MSPSRVEDYTTIDVGGDWPRLRLLCEEPEPRLALECAMRRWLKYDAKWHHESLNWTLRRALQGEAPAPWELSRNGDWTFRIDNAVQEAVESEVAAAVVGNCAEMATFGNASAQDGELMLSDVETTRLSGIAAKIRRRVEPTPDSPEWWVPLASCHIIVPFGLELARLGYAEGDWRILWGKLHSTVLDMRHKRVFDLLLWDELEHPERSLGLALRCRIVAGAGAEAQAADKKR
jgi:hypothetical protein